MSPTVLILDLVKSVWCLVLAKNGNLPKLTGIVYGCLPNAPKTMFSKKNCVESSRGAKIVVGK